MLLAEAPPRIAAASRGLARKDLHTAPKPSGWSASDVLAHLRACADVWGGCIAAMISNDARTLRAINPRTWIKQTNYLELEFRRSFRSYARQRTDLLALLEPLPRPSWSRAAIVTGAGAPRRRTVFFYAEWLARHERQHVKQIEALVKPVQVKKRR
jgi:hypothetical protein